MKALSAYILSIVILISNYTGRYEAMYSSEQYEEAFVEQLLEYGSKFKEDESKNTCWINKPTSTLKMYFGINPSVTVRLIGNFECCIYCFTSGNNYYLLARDNRIINMWAMNGTKINSKYAR